MIRAVICDDEMAVQRIIRFFIETDKIPIQIIGTAKDGKESLELIRREKPDLVFMDIHMPYLNGFEVIEQMKDGRVIIITAYDSFEYAQKALRMNVCDILSKPIDLEQLKQAVNRAVGWEFTDNETVNQMLTYIHLNFEQKIELEDLANVTYCTESHIARLFKKHMGMTILSYVHKMRIDQAIFYMKKEKRSIQEAALRTGYQNLNNFYKYFKLYTGETPKVFLQKYNFENGDTKYDEDL